MKRWLVNREIHVWLAFAAVSAFAFNNCNRTYLASGQQAEPSSRLPASEVRLADGGGGAYDGKVSFHRYDPEKCQEKDENGQPLPNATLQIARGEADQLSVDKVRESCTNLMAPIAISAASIRIVADGSITYEKTSYIAERPNSIAPIGSSLLSPQFLKLWGRGKCIIDGLWNTDIGNGNRVVSQRFRAAVTDSIAAIRVKWADGAAAKGTGGTIRIRVYPDDGSASHLPDLSAIPLAEAIFVPNLSNGSFASSSDQYKEVAMTAMAPLVQGRLYHVYYENLDANNSQNYLGVESQTTGPHHGRPCRFLAPDDWALLMSSRSTPSALVDRTKELVGPAFWAPIVQLRTTGGSVYGNSNIGSGNSTSTIRTVRAGAPVRERISPLSAHNLARFHLQTAAAIAGTLNWRLKLSDDTTVIASGSITERAANYKVCSVTVLPDTGFFKWYEVALLSPVLLSPGQTYFLEFSSADGSEWAFANQLDGTNIGFLEGAAFGQSIAEHFINGQWLGVNNWSPLSSGTAVHWRLLFEDQ